MVNSMNYSVSNALTLIASIVIVGQYLIHTFGCPVVF